MGQWYAGIDEAGYGPMFGPLVIACAALEWQPPAHAPSPTPGDWDLWKLMRRSIARQLGKRRGRIAIADSKELYSPQAGLEHLERGVLAFAHHAGLPCDSMSELLHAVALDEQSRWPDQFWYSPTEDSPVLPSVLTVDQHRIACAQLERGLKQAGVSRVYLSAAVIFEDRYNTMLHTLRSKAKCAWTFVSRHIEALRTMSAGSDALRIFVDRQGGRTRYTDLLQMSWPDLPLRVLEEKPLLSQYQLGDDLHLDFMVSGEKHHLPIALASMTAKYVRELLMGRFNAFFSGHISDLKPTAGYFKDGQRFLNDIRPHLNQLGISEAALVRQA